MGKQSNELVLGLTRHVPIGTKIAELREEKGWTLDDLSTRSGLDRTNLWKIETGRARAPQAATISKLAKAFGISVDVLSPSSVFYADLASFDEDLTRLMSRIVVMPTAERAELIRFMNRILDGAFLSKLPRRRRSARK